MTGRSERSPQPIRQTGPNPSPIFGRDDEVRSVVEALLTTKSTRLVTLVGRGGVGKTRLAIEIAERVGTEAGWPVTSVALSDASSAHVAVAVMASTLGAAAHGDTDPLEAVAGVVGREPHLVVLDGLEQLLAAAPELAGLIEWCPGLRLLVTSQAPLRVASERVVEVDPLPLPSPTDDLGALRRQPAVAVYCARAEAVDRHFSLDPRNAAAVVELCRRLEGLPLAIELAAARSPTVSAGDLLGRLDATGLSLLQRPMADVPSRHHDMRAAIDWTHELLSPEARRLLDLMSACHGSVDLDTVVALDGGPLGDVVDSLAELVDFHLVDPVRDLDPGRYTVPPSIRTYARTELAASGRLELVQHRHVSCRAAQAAEAGDGLDDAQFGAWRRRAIADEHDLRGALEQALRLGMVEEAADLAVALGDLWEAAGYDRGREHLVESALALTASRGRDPRRLVILLCTSALLGLRHRSRLVPGTLVGRLDAAAALAEEHDDDRGRLLAATARMRVVPMTGDLRGGLGAASAALDLAGSLGNPKWLADTEVWAGMVHQLAGDGTVALDLGNRAMADARRRDDRLTMVRVTHLLATLQGEGDIPDLLPTEEALAMARHAQMPFFVATLLPRLAAEAMQQGDVDRARSLVVEALELARTMPGSPLVGLDVLVALHLAALRDDTVHAAFLHGALAVDAPRMKRYLRPWQWDRLEATVASVCEALGPLVFDAAVASGRAATGATVVEVALEHARRPSPHGDPAPPGSPRGPGAPTGGGDGPLPPQPPLTPRQEEVLRLLAGGLSNKEIAAHLGVSDKTVMHHTTAIYRSLGVRGRSEATAWAFRAGLVG